MGSCSIKSILLISVVSFLSTVIIPTAAMNHLIKSYQELTSDKITYTYASRHHRRSALYTLPNDHLDEDLVIQLTLSETPYKLMLSKVDPPIRNYTNITVNGKH